MTTIISSPNIFGLIKRSFVQDGLDITIQPADELEMEPSDYGTVYEMTFASERDAIEVCNIAGVFGMTLIQDGAKVTFPSCNEAEDWMYDISLSWRWSVRKTEMTLAEFQAKIGV